jgi:shikimate dehydrogenase
VLGKPVGHSLSPVLHRAAYLALGLTGWSYTAIECDEGELPGLLADSGAEVVGYSCTMPLKRQVLRVASSVSHEAVAIGAGNTLLRGADGWHADNTDWIGIRDALAAASVPLGGAVVVLGAGGTAQAALAALAGSATATGALAGAAVTAGSAAGPVAGAEQVTVLVREPARAGDLLATAKRLGVPITLGSLADRRHWLAADLIIDTLPAGAADAFAQLPFRKDQALLGAAYDPWPTPLAAAVAAAGGTVVSGAAMLLYQAARQVELMTGHAAPVEAMRAAMRAAAPDCGC